MYTVTFPAGVNSSQLNTLITDDNILEDDETFNLTINQSSLPDGVVVGDASQVTVTIVDDDGECDRLYSTVNIDTVLQTLKLQAVLVCYISTDITVSFNQSTYMVNEDEGPAQPVLVLSNPSSTDITVIVNVTDGSANGKSLLTLKSTSNYK